jgi:putative Mg2+ transporter-C (MgtC) family protein
MSFLFGVERQLHNKSAGFGTFIFVSAGSCALGTISLLLSPDNILIIVGGVITGIGFLGAGALIKSNERIFGFTTAASIWTFSIIGLCIGLGEYLIGVATYIIVWMVIVFDRMFESRGIGSYYQRKVIIKTKRIVEKEEVLGIFGRSKWRLVSLEIDKENDKSTITYLVSAPRSYVSVIRDRILKKEWLDSVKIE